MITYIYVAKGPTGEEVRAEVQADSEQSAAKLLINQRLVPISIEAKDKPSALLGSFQNRVRTKDIVLFTRQLATLINAGLPLTQSLRTVREQINNKALLGMVNQVISDVEGGSTLSDAFAKHPKVFNNIFINLISAGEASGSLDKSLIRIADQQEKDAVLVSKIRSAMVYPAIVLMVIGGVLIFMLTSVIPQVEQLYKDLGKALPLLTNIMVVSARFLNNFWWLVLFLLIGAAVAFRRYIQTPQGRSFIDGLKMRLPIFGMLFKKLYMARFCRTSSVLLSSGLPMLEMLRIVQGSMNNVHVENSIKQAANKVKGGKALSTALENDPYFLTLVPQMLKIGEQSGTLDAMMAKTATFYEEELDTAVKTMSTTIEPLLMVVLGVTVGIIVAAILLPIYGLINLGNLGGGAPGAGS